MNDKIMVVGNIFGGLTLVGAAAAFVYFEIDRVHFSEHLFMAGSFMCLSKF